MDDIKIAHISDNGMRRQTVKQHLQGTAELAAEFASAFGCADIGEVTGLLHDVGKYSTAFQEHIRGKNIRTDHASAGAQIAFTMLRCPQMAFAIAGHHSGLPDGGNYTDREDEPTLCGRMKKKVEPFDEWKEEIKLPSFRMPLELNKDRFSQVFFTRMLYSCLVDADYLDTESFMNGASLPRGNYDSIDQLLQRLEKYISPWWDAKNDLNRKRCHILQECIQAGDHQQSGMFTLTVPTGGGKTVSSLAFALHMAHVNNMQRVIYVIPYTSVIDQNAGVFEDILGSENVIEHHSGTDNILDENKNDHPEDYRKALATENWDAPVIVTTAVQFFESLFSAKSSRCRKLHNITDSVIIFDEAQTLPLPYLKPCLMAMIQLVKYYHSSIVLCTATQPALENMIDALALGMKVTEICPDRHELYKQFHRTTLVYRGKIDEKDLDDELNGQRQVLCVVNRRKTAGDIYKKMQGDGNFCLTTLLCPADRKKKLKEIRERLQQNEPCRVISTSLIEAGVDVDFPVAYREETGLDSILQTAGRCNREGKHPAENSKVFIFQLNDIGVPKMLCQKTDAEEDILSKFDDPSSPEAVEKYFTVLRNHMGDQSLDMKNILKEISGEIEGCKFPFRQVAEQFHLIETATRTIYIRTEESEPLIQQLLYGMRSRTLYRKLGVYSVNIYQDHFERLEKAGVLQLLEDGNAILNNAELYQTDTGLSMDIETGEGVFI